MDEDCFDEDLDKLDPKKIFITILKGNETSIINIPFDIYYDWLGMFPPDVSFFPLKPTQKINHPLVLNSFFIVSAPMVIKIRGITSFLYWLRKFFKRKNCFDCKYRGYVSDPKSKANYTVSFLEILANITRWHLDSAKYHFPYRKDFLINPKKIKLEIIYYRRKLKQQQAYYVKLYKNFSPKEPTYVTLIKQWLADEEAVVDEILSLNALPSQSIKTIEPTPSIKALPPPTKTKADTLKDYLRRYEFYNLEKVKRLSEQNKDVLVQKISENDLPYTIAMFDYLQFILYLEKNHFTFKEELSKEVAKWLKSDKSGRTVRGNINSLLEYTEEDKTRYTAYKHIETVKKDYEKLK